MDHILKGLEQDARVTMERMPMSTQDYEKTIDRLKAFIERTKLSQAKIARAINVSAAQISQLIAGTHKGKTEDLINKLVNYMDTHARQASQPKQGFIETTVARTVYTVIKTVERYSDESEAKIGLVIGDAGHGKSVCLRQYALTNKNSVYIELDDTMASVAVFAAICRAVGVDHEGGMKRLTARLIEHLAERSLVIMLDEASALKVSVLNQLRQIITVRCKCPLILAGNKHLLGTINQSSNRRGYESLDQFYSRLVYVADLDDQAANDDSSDGGLYTAEDIRKLYEYGGIRLTDDAVCAIRKLCRAPMTGRLRTCSQVIAALHTSTFIQDNEKIEAVSFGMAIKKLGLPILSRLPFTLDDLVKSSEAQAKQAKAG
jgi:DNA transposition AAA+ family ATPase